MDGSSKLKNQLARSEPLASFYLTIDKLFARIEAVLKFNKKEESVDEKTDNIIETLEGIRDKLDKKLVEKRLKGLGNCSICGQYTDGADLFTCGNPQCDNELRQELSSRKELLRILDVGSLADVIKGLQQIQAIAEEIKSKI